MEVLPEATEKRQADPGQYTQSTIHHCWIRTRLRQNPRVLSRWSKARLQLQEKLRTRAAKREPHAQAASPTKAPSTSGLRRSSSRESTARRATKPRKTKVYCGNNKLDPQLKINGGHLAIGDRGKCFQQGFGSALFQHVSDEAAFLAKYSGKYEHLVPQRLWYKNSPAPTHEGYQPATLSQCRLRGWGAGSAELARRLRAKRHSPSA